MMIEEMRGCEQTSILKGLTYKTTKKVSLKINPNLIV